MRRLCVRVGLLAVTLMLTSCGSEPTVNRVGVNVVEKSLFQGSWYMARTVIDVDYEASGVGTFPGDAASDAVSSFTLPRIRWVIDKDQLVAFRDYELIEGGEGQPREAGEVYGQPVAAFKIEKHFDIRRAYNTTTGEELNVLEENDVDGDWWERPYMRVDWSRNLLPGYFGQSLDLNAVFGFYKRESTDLLVQAGSQFPESWQPRFDFMQCASSEDMSCDEGERDFADQYDSDELYHMSFVTQEVLSPSDVSDPVTGQTVNICAANYTNAPTCSAINSFVRTSFLKVSERRQYEPTQWNDSRFDRFGYFRLERPTYDRSTGTPDDPALGATDFLNYSVNRHNIWKQWHDDSGAPIPYADRQVRQVVWYTTPELPAHLVAPTFDVIGQWNEVMMATVRQLRGEAPAVYPEQDCQTNDPDGYCFCQRDPETDQVLTPRCPGQYDSMIAPDALPAGVQNPYDCHVEIPTGAEPDLDDPALSDGDFNPWFGARMVGSECVTVLRINNCNRASIADNDGTNEGLACQERGDLRFKFMSYVDQPGTRFLGVATLRGDPVTGEIIAGDANIGGPALDGFRASALRTYDVINGTLDPRDLLTGEDVRGYFENVGRVDLPALPRTDFTPAAGTNAVQSARTQVEVDATMQRALTRLDKLKGVDGRNNVYSDRIRNLAGTPTERKLLDNLETLAMVGLTTLPDGAVRTPVTETMLDRVSPFRTDSAQAMFDAADTEDKLARANVMMPNEFVDDAVQSFVNKHADWPRARLEFSLNRLLYRQTQLHELGHCWGLRHNFGGSTDREHYGTDFHVIDERFPLPNPSDYDTDGENGLSADEAVAFEDDYTQMRQRRELSGIDGKMNASVMEYTSNWYQRLQPIGLYDKAAIAFGYGDLTEAYDGAPSPTTPRVQFKHYLGGEPCNVDAECPFAVEGARSAELLDSNLEHDLTQRCVANPRTDTSNLCSNFDDQVAAMGSVGGDVAALTYRFCSDERASGGSTTPGTIGWCNRFDEGESYREIVRNIAESYERMYPFTNFRRYQREFSFNGYRDALLGRRLVILQNIYQNLIYRYASDPAFREEIGAFGFYDEFLATADILNFYARILGQPAIGGYVFDNARGIYERASTDPDAAGTDLSVPLGLGRYFNSDYQRGLTGIDRMERIGSFVDSFWVLQLMTTRGSQARYAPNIAFYANFYDLFPNEMQQIFSGMIRNAPEEYMPRLQCSGTSPRCSDPRLIYMDFYRGDCSSDETCRPSPQETYQDLPVLSGGGNFTLQIYAAVYGLSEFPVYFDTSFANQLFICVEGGGECPTPGPNAVEGVDYVRYTSPQYLKSFLAWQLESAVGVGEQTSIGFAMVKQTRDNAFILEMLQKLSAGTPRYARSNLTAEEQAQLRAIPYQVPTTASEVENEISRAEFEVSNLESFLNEIIHLQRDLKIRDFGYFPPGSRR